MADAGRHKLKQNKPCKAGVLLPPYCVDTKHSRDPIDSTVTTSKTMTRPVLITVAPNGARKLKQDHSALPISAQELGATAASSSHAGAAMLHLHVRDKALQHSLDPELYRAAIAEVRRQAGAELIIQITTEAVGKFQPEEQIESVKRTRPEAVSLAIRELIRKPIYESAAAKFFQWLYRERIAPQWILYDQNDIEQFKSFCVRGLIPDELVHVLLVLGRYHQSQQSDPAELEKLIPHLDPHWLWSVCAFGSAEGRCMKSAVALGGHCRVGFENNLEVSAGRLADSNTELVETTAEAIIASGHTVADAGTARELFQISRR